ncbi:profilin [Lentinula raphanica]|uniref:Profilin n=1 Tax=Lentinula raphanica TaxID=153919 RepID=A0AA38UDN0_9AGAR|nr:profilin [Lentinula raphanica]KAJ3826812.1 profilin [Lentinula raphanica]KAJ3838032.1 profilin [Lentinula raphanica]KAJ3974625.1 profilin [Lentinula raphanica]
MSWQAYVDTNLLGTKKVTEAAILGAQGGVWATSSGFELSAAEQAAIVQAHKNPDETRSSGLVIGGVKYFCLQADARSIYLKKGADGVILVKTQQAILCCLYKGPLQQPEAAPVVEGLADYLINAGF